MFIGFKPVLQLGKCIVKAIFEVGPFQGTTVQYQ